MIHVRTLRWPQRLGAILGVVVMLLSVTIQPASAQPTACGDEAPNIERPGQGLVGSIDPPEARGLADSVYREYNYAGTAWITYDLGSPPLCSDPGAQLDTWVGNQLFNIGKTLVAGSNALHYTLWEGGLTHQIDKVVADGAGVSYRGFGVPFISIALLLVGLLVLRYVLSGDNAGVLRASGRALTGLLIVSTALAPMAYSAFADKMLFSGLREAQRGIAQEMYPDSVVVRDVVPTKLHTTVVYENWLRGVFGSAESPQAKEYGRRLLDSLAFTWAETTRGDDAKPSVIKAKNAEFKKIAEAMKTGGDYQSFTGEKSRIGAGFRAFWQGITIGLFSLLANLTVLMAQLLLRGLLLFAPIIGLLCMLPGRGATFARAGLGVLLVGVLMNGVSIFYTYLSVKILSLNIGGWGVQMAIITLLTALAWYLAAPTKRIRQLMASMSSVTGLERANGPSRFTQWRRHNKTIRLMRRQFHRKRATDDGWREWLSSSSADAGETPAAERNPEYAYAYRVDRPESRVFYANAVPRAGALNQSRGGPHGSGTERGEATGGDRPSPKPGGAGPGSAGGSVRPPSIDRPEVSQEASSQTRPLPGRDTPLGLPAGEATAHSTEPSQPSSETGAATDKPELVQRPEGGYDDPPVLREAPLTPDGSAYQIYRPASDSITNEPPAEGGNQHGRDSAPRAEEQQLGSDDPHSAND